MKTLLWREFHWNRLILVMGASILVLPYVTVVIAGLWPRDDGIALDDSHFAVAAVFSYGLSQLTIAFFGGNAFAGERADRSAEFMAYLPISRTQRLISKLGLAAIVIAVIWGVNLLIFWIADGRFPWQSKAPYDVKYTAVTGFVMFGVGWLISSFQSSPTFAVCGGIAVPMLTLVGLSLTALGFEIEDEKFLSTWYSVISIVFGTLGFALGTWLFLKRVDP